MSIVPRTVPTKQLAQNLASGGTTLYLNNTLDWDGAQLSSADFGTQLFAVLRNSNNTQLEIVEVDPTTVTSAAAITITKRALGYGGGQTASTETAYDWLAGDTFVELGSDTPQLLAQLVEEVGAETIAGVKTFSSLPATTAGNPVADNDLVRKAYADAILSGGSGIPNRVVIAGTAGETVAAGNLVYLKESDGRWWKCDADTAATVNNIILGIAQGAGTAGNAVTSGVLTYGLDSNQSGLTANSIAYAGNTAGAVVSTTPGTTEVTVGYSTSTTTVFFAPRYNQEITEDIQDGLASTTALTASNKVVSQKDFQIGAEIYAADSVGTDAYAVTLSPVPTAYVTGMTVRFKAGTANTGAATLNVNSLGAKTLKKHYNEDLATGDIVANQIVSVIYDGTNFQLLSPSAATMSVTKVGSFQKDSSNTTATTIAHGFGRVPKLFRLRMVVNADERMWSVGSYDGTTQKCHYWGLDGAGSSENAGIADNILYFTSAAGGTTLIGTVSWDATNITISYARAGTPTTTLDCFYEAIA